ncbi:MAG TPA: Rossmann-like and DUF2520 domain-containing protein [Actinomycetota bacterium]|nr:Rossmann-like and DUF2520 domain-containing protein [Actinomycetota bacterium]
MDVAVVGAGRVGTALAVLLGGAGHRIVAASGREDSRARVESWLPGVPYLPPGEAARAAEVTLLAVPDDVVAGTCDGIAAAGGFVEGAFVAHLSGAAPLLALGPARAAGAHVLSMHPLQTVPDVESGVERLPGASVAITAWDEPGFELGERLAADWGGMPFRLDEERKPLYHAAAVFCSNYLVVVEGLAELLFRAAGVADPVPAFAPLAEATLANVVRSGPEAALTGPVARGDAGTVRRNLEAISAHAPEAVSAYVALADAAVHLAVRARRLGPAAVVALREVLDEWR